MRLIFATIVAAATLTSFATPVFADGERGGGQYEDRRDDNRGNYNNNRGNGHNDRRDWDRRDDRRDNRYQDNRGARYWGPSARQWSHWDNQWGDPNRYARQWGFDRYDHNRGWQRGNTWYANPSQWGEWGGWSWSFSLGNGGNGNGGYNQGGYSSGGAGNYGGYNQYGQNQCVTYRTEDWINGRRAQITYVGCTDRYGRIIEQPGTRQIERWLW